MKTTIEETLELSTKCLIFSGHAARPTAPHPDPIIYEQTQIRCPAPADGLIHPSVEIGSAVERGHHLWR